jgi:hypothetical protein
MADETFAQAAMRRFGEMQRQLDELQKTVADRDRTIVSLTERLARYDTMQRALTPPPPPDTSWADDYRRWKLQHDQQQQQQRPRPMCHGLG